MKLTERVKEKGRRRQTKNCYINPYLLSHVMPISVPPALFSLLGWGRPLVPSPHSGHLLAVTLVTVSL